MTNQFLLITSIDHYGWNGRDHHPDDSDIGKIVRPFKMDVIYQDKTNENFIVSSLWEEQELSIFEEAIPYLCGREDNNGEVVTLYTCVTGDGKILELMEHEVEWV